MSKKRRAKRLVRIVAIYDYADIGKRQVYFRWTLGIIPYRGNVTVEIDEDPWPKIEEYFDSGHTGLLQQEREV